MPTVIPKKRYADLATLNEDLRLNKISRSEAQEIVDTQMGSSLVYVVDEEVFMHKRYANFCEASEQYYYASRGFIVVVEEMDNNRNHTKSRTVRRENDPNQSQCQRSGIYFDTNKFTFVDVGDMRVCWEYYRRYLYLWESDDLYHWDEEGNPSTIPDYHENRRPDDWEGSNGYGLELEVYVTSPDDVYPLLPDKFFGEKDGSLSRVHGIEIIGNPIPFESFYKKNDWKECLEMLTGNGLQTPDGYGLHVNISKTLFSGELHCAKFIVAVNKMEKLGKLVGRRDDIYHGRYHPDKRVNRMTTATNKCEPVNVKYACLEVRIFKAAGDYTELLVAIEYCEAVKEMTRINSILDISKESDAEKNLFKFIKSQKKYRNLTTFLQNNIVLH
jgi:hypothetical protein